jgi:hypothetical protein
MNCKKIHFKYLRETYIKFCSIFRMFVLVFILLIFAMYNNFYKDTLFLLKQHLYFDVAP